MSNVIKIYGVETKKSKKGFRTIDEKVEILLHVFSTDQRPMFLCKYTKDGIMFEIEDMIMDLDTGQLFYKAKIINDSFI